MTKSQDILLSYIQTACKGGQCAQTSEELAKSFGGDRRKIQKEIQSLREAGYPILSSDSGKMGYFYPVSQAEATDCFRSMSNRAKKTFRTLQNIRNGLAVEFGNQLKLDVKEVA